MSLRLTSSLKQALKIPAIRPEKNPIPNEIDV